MYRFLLGSLTTLIAVTSFAIPREEIAKEVEGLRNQCITIRRHLHQYPELSNRERETGRYIADHLEGIGIPVQRGVAGHGVVAIIDGALEGPTVAVRADIDALPVTETIDVPYRSRNEGVKHACGHDVHTTIALTTAEVLWNNRDQLPGKVVVFFQPAEEGPPPGEPGGAPLMIDEGFLSDHEPSAIFALHAWPAIDVGDVGVKPGPLFASSDRFAIRITGKQSHGAQPHLGIDPIVVGSQIVTALQSIDSRRIDPVEPVVVTVGTFHAGTRFNIVPGSAEMEGTLRTLSPAVRDEARRLITSISENVGRAGEASVEVIFDDASANPVLMNDSSLSARASDSLRGTLGDEHVIAVDSQMVAEDFAHFAERVPSFYFLLGVRNEEKGITANVHTPEFDVDEESLIVGSLAMTNLVVDYLKDSAHSE